MGWRRPKAPRGQQRRGYSDRTSERSRHLVGARVVWEAKRDEKLGLRRPLFYFEAPWTVYSVLDRGRRALGCGRCGGSASRDCWISPPKQSTTRHMSAWFTSVSWDTPRRVEQTPQIERRNRTKRSQKTSCQI